MKEYFAKNEEEQKQFVEVFGLLPGQPLFPYDEAKNEGAVVRADKKTICINAVCCVIKHHAENKYLVVKHHRSGISGYLAVCGSIDDGEIPEQTGSREILEETGYKNVKFIKNLGQPYYFNYFKASKDENRLLRLIPLYFETVNEEVEPMSEYEKAKQEPEWLFEKDIEQFLNTRPFHREFYLRLKNIV
jgi:8-oxo-dGTP pyrophosphatase MutT (NUDIX family)